jgi:molybdenum cofactor cytidylyltransferase
MSKNISIIILAAGESRRMGSPKQLADFGGKSLLRHAVETALASTCNSVVVVLGAAHERIVPALDGLPVTIAVNPNWQQGMGTSIQAGLAAAPPNVDGVILTLGDQPMLTAEHYNQLTDIQTKRNAPVVSARYANTVGVPVLFMRPLFEQLNQLAPDMGCKPVILGNRDTARYLDLPEAEYDVDTPETLAAVRDAFAARVAELLLLP